MSRGAVLHAGLGAVELAVVRVLKNRTLLKLSFATQLLVPLVLPARSACQIVPVNVQLEGVRGEERRNVLATLSIVGARVDTNGSETRIERLHARAPREIALALQPFGYYRPNVESQLIREANSWVARYTVTPGPRILVRRVSIELQGEGAEEASFRNAVERFPVAEGAPLSHPAYELGKTRLLNVASELGYLDARFDIHEMRIDLESYTADIELAFSTGPRYLFGQIAFHQDIVAPDILETLATFRRGEPFSISPLLELQSVLSESPYFSRVEVVPRRDSARGLEVPIDVNLLPRKPQRYEIGAGYGTNTGPRGNAQAEFRRLNRSGHRALGEVSASFIEKRIAGRYLIPFSGPRPAVLSFAAGFARLTPTTSTSNAALVSTTLGTQRGLWQETIALTYQLEDFEVGTTTGTSYLFMPSVSWSRTQANDRIFPTRGGRVRFELQGAAKGIASNASFARARIGAKVIQRLTASTRMLLRLDLGGMLTSQLNDLPPSIRFFAGGDQTVRGFSYRSLGPVDSVGNVIGGRVLGVSSVELDQLVFRRIYIAGFFDFGNALDTVNWNIEQGAGGGVRWLSPVGLVRFDLAVALTEPGYPLRIHITIGPDL